MQNKKITLFVALTSLSLLNPLAAAKESGFAAIDTNDDGSLSLKEYQKAILKSNRAKWKADGVSKKEQAKAEEKVQAMSQLSFESLDANDDGKVEEVEIVAYNRKKSGLPPQVAATSGSASTSKYDFPPETQGFQKNQFKKFDVNGDGVLDLTEFTKYLTPWLTQNQPEKDPITWAPTPFRQKDSDGNGQLSTWELFSKGGAPKKPKKSVVSSAPKSNDTYDFPPEAKGFQRNQFKKFDANGDGLLNLAEYTKYLTPWLTKNMPERDPVTWAPTPFGKKDTNGDGQLSPRELY